MILQVTIPCIFRPERGMTDRELLGLCAMNEMLWIERDSQGWLHARQCGSWQVACLSGEIGARLYQWATNDGPGKAFANAGFVLPDGSMLGPNLAWMLNERCLSLTRRERSGFAPRCPDFVIEILSPFMRLADLHLKMDLWIANGAQIAWLINIELKTVTIHRIGKRVEVLERPAVLQGDDPIAGFELNIGEVWTKCDRW